MQRHSSLYLSDGNIVLRAVKSPGAYVLYRVHRSLLSKHSSVLESMLDLPCNASTNETYEGVPVVTMHDSAEDLESLLKLLYGERSFLLLFHPYSADLASHKQPVFYHSGGSTQKPQM